MKAKIAWMLPQATNARGYQNLEEARRGPPPGALEGDSPPNLRFGTSSLQSCERINFCCFKPRSVRFLRP